MWWGGGGGVLASGGASDSAASSLPGVGVVEPSRSQESLVLTAPSSVASSTSAECGLRSRSRVVWVSTEDCSLSCSSRSSLSRGGETHGERHCARSRSGGSSARPRKSRSRSTTHLQSRGHGRYRRDSSRSPSARVQSRWSRSTGLIEFACALGLTVRGLDECPHTLLAIMRPGVTFCSHTGPTTSHVTIAGHAAGPFSPLTVRCQGIGVGGQGKVAGIARRLLLPPRIAVTLG